MFSTVAKLLMARVNRLLQPYKFMYLFTMQVEDEEILPNLIVEIFRNGLTTFLVLVVLVIEVFLPLFIFHKQSISMTRFYGEVKVKGNKKGLSSSPFCYFWNNLFQFLYSLSFQGPL